MQIRATYTEALVRRATFRFWIRFIAWHGFLAVAILAAGFLYLLAMGDSSWYVPVMGTVLAFALFTGSSVYFVYRSRALGTLRRMTEPTVTIDFSDEGISIESDLGGGNLAWRAIPEVWTFPEVWLVFSQKWIYFTVPAESLTDDIRQFIRRKVIEHGGRVR